MLILVGSIVNNDAMDTQTTIARTIRNRGADYVPSVKDNHPKLTDSILVTCAGISGKIAPVLYFEEQVTTTTGPFVSSSSSSEESGQVTSVALQT